MEEGTSGEKEFFTLPLPFPERKRTIQFGVVHVGNNTDSQSFYFPINRLILNKILLILIMSALSILCRDKKRTFNAESSGE